MKRVKRMCKDFRVGEIRVAWNSKLLVLGVSTYTEIKDIMRLNQMT